MNMADFITKSSAPEQRQTVPPSAAAPTGILRALLPADLIMCKACYKSLSSYAVVAAGWVWIEARNQRRHWYRVMQGTKNQLPSDDFKWLDISVNRLAGRMGCGWRQARTAIDDLIACRYLRKVTPTEGAKELGRPIPTYTLFVPASKYLEVGTFERVTMPQSGGPIARQHLSIVLQRFTVVTMKNNTLMKCLGLKRRTVQRYLRELMDSGEIERDTHAGYGQGKIRKLRSNARPVRNRDRDTDRLASSVQSAHASVHSAHASVHSAPSYKTPENIHDEVDTPLKRGALPGSPASSGFRDPETAKPRSPVTQGNGVAGRDYRAHCAEQ